MDDAHAAVEVAAVEVRRRVRMNEEDERGGRPVSRIQR
jgi:hypothetical protein